MKNKQKEVSSGKQKNPTTNYRMSSHKVFCERCYKFNRKCPATGTKHKSESCNI